MKIEYMVIYGDLDEARLNELGADRWKLVSEIMYPAKEGAEYQFKYTFMRSRL